MTQTDKMLSRKEGGVGIVTFNNPERHNAVSLDMWEATKRILDGLLHFRSSAGHAGTTFLNFVSPSCRERRAASSEQPIATAISRCGRSPT